MILNKRYTFTCASHKTMGMIRMISLLYKNHLIKFFKNCQGAERGVGESEDTKEKAVLEGQSNDPHHQNTTRFTRWRQVVEKLKGEHNPTDKEITEKSGK